MVKNIVTLVIGFAAGYATANIITKKKNEEKIAKEIEAVKAVYEKHIEAKQSEPEEAKYEEMASEYTSTEEEKPKKRTRKKSETKKKKVVVEAPYVISPSEFGDIDDYACVSLTYYADGYLADDYGELIENVEECIGWEALDTFGEYEPDAVHVRNDVRKTDYEILRSLESYKEA